MTITTMPFDAAALIETAEDAALFVQAALDEAADAEDPAVLTHALGTLARSRGMALIAERTGLSRQGLYKAFGSGGNPSLDTAFRVMRALGLKISAAPATKAA